MKGWLISSSPSTRPGDSTPWCASFWEFCARYCEERFGDQWHLSPEQSLSIHGEHAIKLRHVHGDWQAAWKLSRQFLQRVATASEQGYFRAALGQSNGSRQPYPRRGTRDNENAILDLHRSILLFQFDQNPSINIYPLAGCSRRRRGCDIGLRFVIAHLFEIGNQSRPGRAPCQPFLGERA